MDGQAGIKHGRTSERQGKGSEYSTQKNNGQDNHNKGERNPLADARKKNVACEAGSPRALLPPPTKQHCPSPTPPPCPGTGHRRSLGSRYGRQTARRDATHAAHATTRGGDKTAPSRPNGKRAPRGLDGVRWGSHHLDKLGPINAQCRLEHQRTPVHRRAPQTPPTKPPYRPPPHPYLAERRQTHNATPTPHHTRSGHRARKNVPASLEVVEVIQMVGRRQRRRLRLMGQRPEDRQRQYLHRAQEATRAEQ